MMGHVLVTSGPDYNCSWTLLIVCELYNFIIDFIDCKH